MKIKTVELQQRDICCYFWYKNKMVKYYLPNLRIKKKDTKCKKQTKADDFFRMSTFACELKF